MPHLDSLLVLVTESLKDRAGAETGVKDQQVTVHVHYLQRTWVIIKKVIKKGSHIKGRVSSCCI